MSAKEHSDHPHQHEGHMLEVEDVRRILAGADYDGTKKIIERAEQALNDVKNVMVHLPSAHNGKLVTGTIDYAAFRIETLSLIFEVAQKTFRKSAKDPDAAYQRFLRELGDEVGLTFARDLMGRLNQHHLLLLFQDLHKLLELWASFENDAGAGQTAITHYDPNQITVRLSNNPLRRAESTPHAHCGFYRAYLASLINEIFKVRARHLKSTVHGAEVRALNVTKVTEQIPIQDQCLFVIQCGPERLTRAFDLLTEAYNQFYRLTATDDHVECMTKLRAALVAAQMGAIDLDGERPPRNLHEIYKGTLPDDIFKQMDSSYQRVSKALHGEAKSSARMQRRQAWNLLLDVRTCVYALEGLDLDDRKKETLQNRARKFERLSAIEDLAERADSLAASDKQELKRLVAEIRGGKELSVDHQHALVLFLKRIGEKAWDVARPVLSDVLAAAIKSEFGL